MLGVSNPNDLKNTLIDAARYRWLRENMRFAYNDFLDGNESPEDMDEFIDLELAGE